MTRHRRVQPVPERLTVNRRAFMAWVDGILLDRDAAGNCLVLDGSRAEKDFEAAEAAMEAGETIVLTDDRGTPVTTMRLMGPDETGDPDFEPGYVEEEVESGDGKTTD